MSLSSLNFIHPSTFNFPRRQYFCLPFGIISYITQNPISSDGLLKLQKTCKYFFGKNKIAVIDCPFYFDNDSMMHTYIYVRSYGGYRLPSKGIKYWPILKFSIHQQGNDLSSIYRCSLKELRIYDQNLKLSELDFLLNGGDKIIKLKLIKVNVYDSREDIVTCDQILSKVSNIQNFEYECENESFTTETFEKIYFMQLNSKLMKFDLSFYHLSQTINFSTLFKFIRKNMENNSIVFIEFRKVGLVNHLDELWAKINEELLHWLKANNVSMNLFIDGNYENVN